MKFSAFLAATAALGLMGVSAQPPTPPSCDTYPACGTCSAHSKNGCQWCSDTGNGEGGCLDSSDSNASCDASGVLYEDGVCYPAYVVTDAGVCELSSADGVGMTLEACQSDHDLDQVYRCETETGELQDFCSAYNGYQPLRAYTVGCGSDPDAACDKVDFTPYSCDASTLQCVEDKYATTTEAECDSMCGQNSIPELAGDWTSFPINADYDSEGANTRWSWSFGSDDGLVVVTNPMGVGQAQILRSGPDTFAMAFVNGSASGSSMFGGYFLAPTGPATDSFIFGAAAPGSDSLGDAPLSVMMYGGGIGTHLLFRDNHNDPAPSPAQPLSEADDTLEGTWRGLSVTDMDSGVYAFTFAADQSSVAYYDPVTNATASADVTLGDVDPSTGVQSIMFGDRKGILSKTLGTADSNTRLGYLALSAEGEAAPADFRAPLDAPTEGTDEWVLTACLLSDPGLCDFSQSDVTV